jgi:hypothetical protein
VCNSAVRGMCRFCVSIAAELQVGKTFVLNGISGAPDISFECGFIHHLYSSAFFLTLCCTLVHKKYFCHIIDLS